MDRMAGRIDSETQRILRIACVAGAFLAALFVAGTEHVRGRLENLVTLYEEATHRAASRQLRIHEWRLPDDGERRLWQGVAARYHETVPLDDLRLAVPDQLTGLAARCGLDRVYLSEIGRHETENAYFDAFEELIERRHGPSPGEIEGDPLTDPPWAPDEGVRTEEFGYRLRFNASYSELIEFLQGLEASSGLIVLRQAAIKRGKPDLEVVLILTAHRRRA
jgi:hypothetical protein